MRLRRIGLFAAILTASTLPVSTAIASSGGATAPAVSQEEASDNGGGATVGDTPPKQPAAPKYVRAKIRNGKAVIAPNAPKAIRDIIKAGNQLIGKPYVYGGGHSSFQARGYDCSGSVSYALHGGNLLPNPLDSGSFTRWGKSGKGKWIAVYANGGHAYMTVAGIRLDTSRVDDPHGKTGPRWRPLRPRNRGFTVRHPRGW